MLLLYGLLIGLVAGHLLGGRVSRLEQVRFRWAPVALAGLVFQLVLFSPVVTERIGAAGPPLYVGSTVAVLVALLRNIRLPAFPVIAAGAALNLLVIAVNGGHMPAAPGAFAAVTGEPVVPTAAYSNSSLADTGTRLAFLGDDFALPRPIPLANVFSIGDVLIGTGAAMFLVITMRSRHAHD